MSWQNNKLVQHFYVAHASEQAWAIFDGISGWKRIKPGAADGVSNLAALLSTAKTHDRRVNVFLNGNDVERAVLL